jgi:hypothetical protein
MPNNLLQLFAKQFFASLRLAVNATFNQWLKIHGLVCRAAWEFLNSTVGLPLNLI